MKNGHKVGSLIYKGSSKDFSTKKNVVIPDSTADITQKEIDKGGITIHIYSNKK